MKFTFTLIELIVVIVVLGILTAIVTPNIINTREDAEVSALKADARNIETAIDMYAEKNNGQVPTEDRTPVIPSENSTHSEYVDFEGKTYLSEEVQVDRLVKEDFLYKKPKKREIKFYLVEGGSVIWSLGGTKEESPPDNLVPLKVIQTLVPSIEEYKKKITVQAESGVKGATPIEYTISGVTYRDSILQHEVNKSGTYEVDVLYSNGQSEILNIDVNIEVPFTYIITSNEVTITGCKGESKEVIIPSKIEGTQVVTLGENSFKGNNLVNVLIPSSIKTIKRYAFYSNELTELILPDSVTTIEGSAFSYNKLKSVTLPNKLTIIESGIFSSNKITNLTIPESVTSINVQAFANNEITTLEIPKNVKSIEDNSFSSNKLTSVKIPKNTTSIKGSAFSNNPNVLYEIDLSSLTYKHGEGGVGVYSKDGGTIITGNQAVFGTSSYNAINSIGESAFVNANITTAIIPNTVKTINDNAFKGNQLTEIIIPNSVTSIGRFAFYTNKLTNLNIPSSVKTIGLSAFSSNQLTSVTISNSVTSMGYYVFFSNPNLKTVINNSKLKISKYFDSNPTITPKE